VSAAPAGRGAGVVLRRWGRLARSSARVRARALAAGHWPRAFLRRPTRSAASDPVPALPLPPPFPRRAAPRPASPGPPEAPSLELEDVAAASAACPGLLELSIRNYALSGDWGAAPAFGGGAGGGGAGAGVFSALTRLSLADVEPVGWGAAGAADGLPLLHRAAPRLAALDAFAVAGPGASMLTTALTALTELRLVVESPPAADGAEEARVMDFFRAAERLAVPRLALRVLRVEDNARYERLGPGAVGGAEWAAGAAARLFSWAARAAGRGGGAVRDLEVDAFGLSLRVHEALPPLAAALGGRLERLALEGCPAGDEGGASGALLCLPMMPRLASLELRLAAGGPDGYGGVAAPLADAALRALLAPLPALRPGAPALRRVRVLLPRRAAAPAGGVTWGAVEELRAANRGLLELEFEPDRDPDALRFPESRF
jgi:hypothetical protein